MTNAFLNCSAATLQRDSLKLGATPRTYPVHHTDETPTTAITLNPAT